MNSGFFFTHVSLFLVLSSSFLPAGIAISSSASITSWQTGTPFPAGNTEVGASGAYNGVLYYVGGNLHPSGVYTNSVYYTTLFSNGSMGKWVKSSHSYPGASGIWALQCPAYAGYVYCIGGDRVPGGTTNAAYFTTVNSAGLGTWRSTSSYPIKVRFESCVPYGGYMYCVAGSPSANSATKAVYFAQILPNGGLDKWAVTTPYSIAAWAHCVASSGYIFCETDYDGAKIIKLTYYASLSAKGIGAWHQGPVYPIAKEKMQCMENNGSMFCIGGGNGVGGLDGNSAVNYVYTTTLSPSGFGGWKETGSYPVAIKDHSCATYNNYIYCVGGDDPRATSAVYFAQIV